MPAWKASSAFRSIPASARYWGLRGTRPIMVEHYRPDASYGLASREVCYRALRGGQDALAGFLVVEALDREDPLEGGDAARAELRAGGAPELLQGLRGRPCGPVDAGREHRVERVRHVDDPSAERDFLPAQPVGIAGAVVAFVVVPDRWHGVVQEAEAVDDAGALVGVALHQVPLLLGQARRLQQDRVRDRELADVVEERRVTEQVELCLREPQLPADGERELLHAP